jgi:hypothetical protein
MRGQEKKAWELICHFWMTISDPVTHSVTGENMHGIKRKENQSQNQRLWRKVTSQNTLSTDFHRKAFFIDVRYWKIFRSSHPDDTCIEG